MKILKIIITALVALAGFNAYALPITATTGSDFTIDYDAIGGDPVVSIDGLSASVRYYDFTFTSSSALTFSSTLNSMVTTYYTSVSFDFDVTNTSSDPILTSRVSTLGFDTTPDIIAAMSTVSGVYAELNSGNVPNQGDVEFCFTDVNCAGGGSGGVEMGYTEMGSAALLFEGHYSSIDFDFFTVRYQSVTCEETFTGVCPGSASGSSTEVPEPGMIGLLAMGLLGVGVARRRSKV